jgi:hypothetical protein
VALAIQAAQAAQTGQATPAAWAGRVWSGAAREPRTLASYHVQSRRAEAGLSPTLLRATALAARASGRQPAEVWAEALRDWLLGADLRTEAAAHYPVLIPSDPRRTRAWRTIDATLGELRAS